MNTRKVICVLYGVFFCLQVCSAQQTKEAFLNEIMNSISGPKPYLLDTAQSTGFDWQDSMVAIPATKGIIDSSILYQLIANTARSRPEKWNSKDLNHIRCVTKKSKRYAKLMSDRVGSDYEIWFCNNPVYDNNNQFAMVRIGKICGKYCLSSCLYFFEKIKGKWVVILKTFCVTV